MEFKYIYMQKNYTTNLNASTLQPKNETIRFLIDYSKSVKVVKTETNYFIKLHLN